MSVEWCDILMQTRFRKDISSYFDFEELIDSSHFHKRALLSCVQKYRI